MAALVETTWWHLAKVLALSNIIYRSVSCSVLWCSCINHDAKRCSCFAIIISKNVILYRTYLLNTVRWMFAVAMLHPAAVKQWFEIVYLIRFETMHFYVRITNWFNLISSLHNKIKMRLSWYKLCHQHRAGVTFPCCY